MVYVVFNILTELFFDYADFNLQYV